MHSGEHNSKVRTTVRSEDAHRDILHVAQRPGCKMKAWVQLTIGKEVAPYAIPVQ